MNWEIVGYAASVLVVASFIPQLWKGYKTKQLNDLSYYMPGILFVASLLWFVYGLSLNAPPIWIVNILLAFMNVALIIMKYKYSRK